MPALWESHVCAASAEEPVEQKDAAFVDCSYQFLAASCFGDFEVKFDMAFFDFGLGFTGRRDLLVEAPVALVEIICEPE
jgi:hypothetical protein